MSSPDHHAEGLDPVLRYAPRRFREQAKPGFAAPPAHPADPSESLEYPDESPAFSGDRAVLRLQRQLSLEPDSIPEPPREAASDRRFGRIALRTGEITIAAALLAWAIVTIPGSWLHGRDTQRSRAPTRSAMADLAKHELFRIVPEEAGAVANGAHRVAAAGLASPGPADPSARTNSSIAAAKTAIAPAPRPPTAPRETDLPTRRLDRDETTSLFDRGEKFIASGDLASARLLLQRAAEAGDIRAALALAGTFDPNLIGRLGVPGASPDPAMARHWYEWAERLGSAEAPQRLQQLAVQIKPLR